MARLMAPLPIWHAVYHCPSAVADDCMTAIAPHCEIHRHDLGDVDATAANLPPTSPVEGFFSTSSFVDSANLRVALVSLP